MRTKKLYALLEQEFRVTKIDTTAIKGRPYVEILMDGETTRVYEDETVRFTLEGKFDNDSTTKVTF
jgi:hypothetical protein